MIRILYFAVLVILASAVVSNAQTQTPPRRLTLQQAKEIAMKQHPRITVAELRALAARQEVKQAQAAYFPTASINVTAAGADSETTRITAGGLNNPSVFN